jgi:hypothetical protein
MRSRLSKHLHANNILVTERHGFRKGISTESATFAIIDSVFKSLNQKICVGGMFGDLAVAFGCINHEILLATLHIYGIGGVYADWFRYCVTDR